MFFFLFSVLYLLIIMYWRQFGITINTSESCVSRAFLRAMEILTTRMQLLFEHSWTLYLTQSESQGY